MDTVEYWVTNWWLPFVLVLIALLIPTAFTETGQRSWASVWRGVRRVLQAPFRLRLTTTRKQQALVDIADKTRKDGELTARRFQEVCELLGYWPVREDSTGIRERIGRLQNAAEQARESADARVMHAETKALQDMEATRALAQKEIQDAARVNERQLETAMASGRSDGYREAMAEVAAERAVPLPKPVWRLWPTGIGAYVELANVQTDAVASDVRIEPLLSSSYAFGSPNQWPGEFQRQEFEGERLSKLDISFKVGYRDAHGDWKEGDAVLARKPVAARSVPRRGQDDMGTVHL